MKNEDSSNIASSKPMTLDDQLKMTDRVLADALRIARNADSHRLITLSYSVFDALDKKNAQDIKFIYFDGTNGAFLCDRVLERIHICKLPLDADKDDGIVDIDYSIEPLAKWVERSDPYTNKESMISVDKSKIIMCFKHNSGKLEKIELCPDQWLMLKSAPSTTIAHAGKTCVDVDDPNGLSISSGPDTPHQPVLRFDVEYHM